MTCRPEADDPQAAGDGRSPVVLVGVSPGGNAPSDPLSCDVPGGSGERLRRMLCLSRPAYRRLLRVNLSDVPGHPGHPVAPARLAALRALMEGRSVLLLGRVVPRALGFGALSAREVAAGGPVVRLPRAEEEVGAVRVYCAPHPSGLTRSYNHPCTRVHLRRAAWPLLRPRPFEGIAGGVVAEAVGRRSA